jgi:hypothetical protein
VQVTMHAVLAGVRWNLSDDEPNRWHPTCDGCAPPSGRSVKAGVRGVVSMLEPLAPVPAGRAVYWTDRRVIESIEERVRRHGSPPTGADWHAGNLRRSAVSI